MEKYHTGYYLNLGTERFTPKKYSNILKLDNQLRLVSSNYEGNGWKISWTHSDFWNGLEFIINCRGFETAQDVLFNVLCAAAILEGTITWNIEPHYPHLFGTDFEKARIDFLSKPIKGYFSPSVPSYFHLAALASKDVRILNSIVKYQLSTQIYSQHFMDLHESINWKTTEYSYIQMRFAFAIITAYSVIEELGLEIRGASVSKRSIQSDGTWEPSILGDLLARLDNSNINCNENITWFSRGEDTDIESRRPIKFVKLSEWSNGEEMYDETILKVKDGYVYIPDAINHISYLRSSIASHNVGYRIFGLSVFDVANAQFLARRLLLESVHLWK
jgi:hypothetical protein